MDRSLSHLAARLRNLSAAGLLCAVAHGVTAADLLTPLVSPEATLSPVWKFHGLPDTRVPPTRFEAIQTPRGPAVRIIADASYGLLMHPLSLSDPDAVLTWEWAIVRANPAANLRTRTGDDAPIKVCALYDVPLEALPFVERQRLRLARWMTREALPAATLCYVWDSTLPVGEIVPNPYSNRVRSMVLRNEAPRADGWRMERRMLREDFVRAFGREAGSHPQLVGIAVGADADNTRRSSEALLRGLSLGNAEESPGR